MAKIWEKFIIVWERLPIGRTVIIAIFFTVVAILWLLKFLIYRKVSIIEILMTIFWIVIVLIFNPTSVIIKNLLTIIYFLIVVFSIYHFYKIKKQASRGDQQLLNHLKNEPFDFYFRTNKNDKIIDASLSCLNQASLKRNEIKKVKSFHFLTTYFDILTINQKEANDSVKLQFEEDYLKAKQPFKTYKFTLEILEKGKIQTYLGLIFPLYEGKKYLGKNVYFNQERHEILEELKLSLNHAINDLEDAKGQMHLLMSLSEQVILYYDFHAKTYVASDAFNKFTGLIKKEYTFDEFVSCIHPNDLDQYIQQASTINSISTTRIKYRFLINDLYYHVFEDSIYLDKERGLISLVRIFAQQEEIFPKETVVKQDDNSLDLEILEQKKPTTVFEQTSSLLDVVVGKKYDNE